MWLAHAVAIMFEGPRFAPALLALALHGVCACHGSLDATPRNAVELTAADSPFPEPQEALGEQPEAAFAIELSTAVKGPRTEPALGQIQGYDLAGTWRLLPTSLEANGARARWVLARLQVDRFELANEPAGILSKADYESILRSQLQRAILLHVDAQGAVLQLKAQQDTSSVALDALKALAAHLQLAVPASPEQQWQARELDAVGEYSALYSQPRSNAIVRHKEQYLRISGDTLRPIEEDDVLSVHGEDRFSLDDRAQVVALSGLEQVRWGGTPVSPEMTSRTAISAHRLSVTLGALRPNEAQALQDFPARDFLAPAPEAARIETDVATVGDLRSIDEALGRIDAAIMEHTPDAMAQVASLELRLEALVRVSPRAEAEAWELLVTAPHHAERLRLALARGARADSQQRLVQLLRGGELRRDEQKTLLAGLAENPLPSELLLNALLDSSATTALRDSVFSALAGVCQAARASNPALATDTQRALEAELTTSRAKPEKLAVVLRALGRCGDPGSVALLRPYLSHRSRLVQAAASDALGT